MHPIACPECKTTHDVKPQKCPSCSYLFQIDGKDRAKIAAQQILQRRMLAQRKSAAKLVRMMIWIIAAINLIYAFYIKQHSSELFYVQLAVAIGLTGLSLLTYIFPMAAVLLTLIGFLFLYILLPLIIGYPGNNISRAISENSDLGALNLCANKAC